MKLLRFDDAARYNARVGDFLLQNEAEHNLPIGLISGLIAHPERFKETPFLWLVDQGEKVLAVALMTPPANLVLSMVHDTGALDFMAGEIHQAGIGLPGVSGPSEEAAAFSRGWGRLTGTGARRIMAQRIYRLEQVDAPAGVPGKLRPGTLSELDLITSWRRAFNDEVGLEPRPPVEETQSNARFTVENRSVYLWDDKGPVSMAVHTGPTPNGIRIGAVYTPAEHRRRGYASACVAALSQKLLDEGRKFCFLFTDLSNPTSNRIYQQIGYEAVCDFDMYRFDSVG